MTNTYTSNQPSRGPSAAAGDEAVRLADTAADQTREVATSASAAAEQVAATASEEVGRVAGEVAAQGQNLVEEAKGQLHDQVVGQTDKLSHSLRKLSDEALALSQGRAEEAGPLRDYVEQASTQFETLAERIEERGFDGLVEDVERFARRRPGTFLLGTALAGFAAGRLIKAGRATGAASAGAPAPAPPHARAELAPTGSGVPPMPAPAPGAGTNAPGAS